MDRFDTLIFERYLRRLDARLTFSPLNDLKTRLNTELTVIPLPALRLQTIVAAEHANRSGRPNA
jgi:hypothetical protein